MRILVMAGGTGGHVFPALAVAKKLIQQGHTVHWLGTENGMEVGVAQANNIPMHRIAISGLRGKNVLTKLLAPFRLFVSLLQSIHVIWSFNPNVVLGMGGYVSGPAGMATWILGKRLVIHEQNAVAGMTNQILARFSYCVLEAFPQTFPKKIRAKLTGNPVREEFTKLLPPTKRMSKIGQNPLKILVLGGSGGARALNNLIPKVLAAWTSERKIMVWHQAGSKNLADAKQAYANSGVELNEKVKLVDFIQDMPNAYAWADLVICRSGALTVAELAAAGVASVLIPYPYAVDDHQTKNAQHLVDAGAAVLMQESELTDVKLLQVLEELTSRPQKLVSMAQAAHGLAKPQALKKVVDWCLA